MGQGFSGPKAFDWINFTPKATAVLKADPFLLLALVLVLVGCMSLGLIAFWIHFVTNKPYRKPKAVKEKKAVPKK
jgi:hypothetical protein